MTPATLRANFRKLLQVVESRRTPENSLLGQLRADPTAILTAAGMKPDPWQQRLLRSSSKQMLLLCSRQAGKSTLAAALALRTALLEPRSLVLLLSPTQRQSGELFRDKVKRIYQDLNRPVACRQESALTMELANGSRIISLPGDEATIRGYSGVGLLVVDEAARVVDPLYYSIRPMLAVSGGRLVALSTPFGKRGWFHEEWTGQGSWQRVMIKAGDCPRISKEFLAEEERAIGERWFRQEYQCSFEDVIDQVFSYDDVMAACDDTVKPFFAR
jgi:hypothetical protein